MIATRFIPLIVLVIYHAKSQITSTIPQSQPKQLQSNYIHSCCKIDYDNDSDNNNTTQSSTNTLNKCMNESSNKHTADILQTVQSSDNIPRVGIISFATTDIWSYSTFSSSVHQAYAENNNYIYQSYHDSSLYDTNDMRWVKVKIIEEAIHPELGRARNMKYVMWIDADALIVDMNLRIEKVFDDYPEAHFIACADQQTKMNSGVFFVRNSEWSQLFLLDWWGSASERELYSDQVRFDQLFMQREKSGEDLSKKVVLLPSNAFNAVIFSLEPQNQVIHLMGESNTYRHQVFSRAWNHICDHLNSRFQIPLRPQLDLSRVQLLEWAVTIYKDQVMAVLPRLMKACDDGEMSAEDIRPIKRDITRLGVAFTSLSSSTSDKKSKSKKKNKSKSKSKEENTKLISLSSRQQIGSLHTQVFKAFTNNISKRKTRNSTSNQSQPPSDLPEIIKITVELGFQLFEYISSETQFTSLATQLDNLLGTLVKMVLSEHQPGVYRMMADLSYKRGIYAHQQQNHKLSLKYFELQLKYSTYVSKQQGDFHLITPLFQVASMKAVLGKFNEANELFLKAIRLSDKHLGPNSASLPQYLLNFAQSKIEAGQPTDAVPLIQRGLGILKQNAASSSSSVSKRSAFDRELKLKFESQLSRVQHLIDQTDMDTDSDSDEL